MKTRHAGDCTIYAAIHEGFPDQPADGICTCGYGWQRAYTDADWSEMYSEERMRAEETIVCLFRLDTALGDDDLAYAVAVKIAGERQTEAEAKDNLIRLDAIEEYREAIAADVEKQGAAVSEKLRAMTDDLGAGT